MALSADRATAYCEGKVLAFPVATGETIYAGSLVSVNASGYAIPAADTASTTFVGVARHQANNSGGGNGAIWVEVWREGVFEFAATSIGQGDVGSDMYVVDDQTFDETNPGQGIKCGKLVKYISSTKGWLQIGVALATTHTGSADALTVSDADDHFAAATNTVPEQIQDLAKGPYIITIPRFTGWTKDGTDKTIATLPEIELPVPVIIKRAYASVLTAPGSEKTLTIKVGDETVATIVGTAVQGEDESLDIAYAADTDLVIKANETSGGLGANCDLMLVVYKDDGE